MSNYPSDLPKHSDPDRGGHWQAEMDAESGLINDALREMTATKHEDAPLPPVEVVDANGTGRQRAVEANDFRQRPS